MSLPPPENPSATTANQTYFERGNSVRRRKASTPLLIIAAVKKEMRAILGTTAFLILAITLSYIFTRFFRLHAMRSPRQMLIVNGVFVVAVYYALELLRRGVSRLLSKSKVRGLKESGLLFTIAGCAVLAEALLLFARFCGTAGTK